MDDVAAYAGAVRSALATLRAAKTLGRKGGQARSEKKAAAVRANGARGGRPVLMLLVDDLGRDIGLAEAAPGRAGEVVEYGSRIAARTLPDGYVEPATFVVEGRATLRRLPRVRTALDRYDRAHLLDYSRCWAIQ